MSGVRQTNQFKLSLVMRELDDEHVETIPENNNYINNYNVVDDFDIVSKEEKEEENFFELSKEFEVTTKAFYIQRW